MSRRYTWRKMVPPASGSKWLCWQCSHLM